MIRFLLALVLLLTLLLGHSPGVWTVRLIALAIVAAAVWVGLSRRGQA